MQIQKQIEEELPRLRAEIAGAVARGYCYVENSKKVLDPDLLKAMGKELEMLFKKELSTIATKSAEKSLKNWYFEDDELVITKGSWVIDRYKKHPETKENTICTFHLNKNCNCPRCKGLKERVYGKKL